MKKMVFNLALVLLSFSFIFFMTNLNLVSLSLYFVFFTLVFYIEIFNYKFTKKIAINKALFESSSKLKKLFHGKFITSLNSIFLAFVFSISFIFNTISINKFELFYISFFIPVVFILVKFVILKITSKELKYHQILSKKAVVLVTSCLATFIFSLINLMFYEKLNLGFFEYLNSQNLDRIFKTNILNEIYVYSFYTNSAFSWLKSEIFVKYKLLFIVFVFVNKFIYFTAVSYIISLFFYKNSKKIGYFLNTIFLLSFITITFLVANSLNFTSTKENKKMTKSEQIVQIVIKNGSKIKLSKSDFLNLEQNLQSIKNKKLDIAKDEIKDFIDKTYEKGTKNFATKMADFRYSMWSDYLILWHETFDKNSTKFLENKILEFVNESFDKDFEVNLANLIDKNINSYEKSLFANLEKSTNLDLNLSFYDMNYHQNRVKISGYSTFGLAVLSKILLKVIAKTSTKFGSSLVGAGSGVVCGPAAVVCIPTFAVASWFGVDYIFAKSDEKFTRDEFEQNIYKNFNENKQALISEIYIELEQIYTQILDELYE